MKLFFYVENSQWSGYIWEGAQRDTWDHGGFLYLALVEVTWVWT